MRCHRQRQVDGGNVREDVDLNDGLVEVEEVLGKKGFVVSGERAYKDEG